MNLPHTIRRIALQHDRVIDAGPVQVMTASGTAGTVIDPATPEYSLILLLQTAPLFRVGFNRPPRWLAVSPGSLLCTPPDADCEFIGEADGKCLCILIPKARVEDFAQATCARIDIQEEEVFRDPALVQQLATLWHALTTEGPLTRLHADKVMIAVLETMARRTGSLSKRSPQGIRERLSAHTLRHLCEYIEHNLADDIDVTMMAGVANSSPAHFARAFAATVGMTPFRFVMARRLERAWKLLQHTRRSTLDIALEVGFKSPSHFTARFHHEFGVTPRTVRREKDRSLLYMPTEICLDA